MVLVGRAQVSAHTACALLPASHGSLQNEILSSFCYRPGFLASLIHRHRLEARQELRQGPTGPLLHRSRRQASAPLVTHWGRGKGERAPRGALATIFRGSDNSELFLCLSQPLMEPPDAVKSTSCVILGQEQQPEWKASWVRGANSVKVTRLETKGVLTVCQAGPSV